MTTATVRDAVRAYDPGWTVGDALRRGLDNAGIGVGEMAGYLGVNRGTVGGWLNDRHMPSPQTLRLWALRTGLPYEWLCAIRDSNPEPADSVLRLPVFRPGLRRPAGRHLRRVS